MLPDSFPQPSDSAGAAAGDRQSQLTKPPGSLGRLEELAITLAGLQGNDEPVIDPAHLTVFAADQGVVAEGVSAFPQAVTVEMVRNLARGGAAANALAREHGASVTVVDVGSCHAGPLPEGVLDARIAAGSANLAIEPALKEAQLAAALETGRAAARGAAEAGARILLAGEMGIGNTTPAAAVGCALTGWAPADLAGPGTGLDDAGVRHKAEVVEQALHRHGPPADPLEVLRRLGGLDLAAIAGFYAEGAARGLPILVDGFITTAAALAVVHARPAARPWLLFAHRSQEPGHDRLLKALDAEPLLDLGLRLGEGTGALTALPLLRSAAAAHRDMATFAEAGVSGG
jgi:nicotinate-nucleotide--dimethylbenzimidazole phosphoribosyltransferase